METQQTRIFTPARVVAVVINTTAARLGMQEQRSPGVAAGWPMHGRPAPEEDGYNHVRMSEVETLLMSGELDISTPPQVKTKEPPSVPAERPRGRAGFGHTASFFAEQPEAGS